MIILSSHPHMKAYRLKRKQLWSRKEDYGVEAA
jgi:hypothetical protein